MKRLLSLLVATIASGYLQAAADTVVSGTAQFCPNTPEARMAVIKQLLAQPENGLQNEVQTKVLTSLDCANEFNIDHNNILAVIDYSMPSNQKRLWVFDLIDNKLLFHTYVSHGINSGSLLTNYFSNKNNSKASSIGVYNTTKSYYGRHGLSLQLSGLDKGFNDNASSRAVVMHGGWYVEENFIKKYGRPGRSWGCPAVPDTLSKPIIDVLKDQALLVVFYPDENWLDKSKYLNCHGNIRQNQDVVKSGELSTPDVGKRDSIIFADINKDNSREENEPIVVMTADKYRQIFNNSPPLTRMLRRQINNAEYIALSDQEFKNMGVQERLDSLSYVFPVIKLQHGYYATEMEFYPFAKIIEIRVNNAAVSNSDSALVFESKPTVSLKLDGKFIRWLGL